jgi:hypothetical protein
VIERPVEEVFDYVADERHEPNFNARIGREPANEFRRIEPSER